MARKRKPYVYPYDVAVYKGDDFLDVGNPYEVAERLEMSVKSLVYYAYPSVKKRTAGKNRLTVIRIDKEENGA